MIYLFLLSIILAFIAGRNYNIDAFQNMVQVKDTNCFSIVSYDITYNWTGLYRGFIFLYDLKAFHNCKYRKTSENNLALKRCQLHDNNGYYLALLDDATGNQITGIDVEYRILGEIMIYDKTLCWNSTSSQPIYINSSHKLYISVLIILIIFLSL